MDNEEVKKGTVTNNNQLNKKVKKKYFRVEKNRFNASTLREKESKKIFKTQKEYHLSKRKALRELRRLKFHKNKKFITTTKESAHIHSDKESNSFIVQKIIPKKLKIIKDNKKISKNINYFSKSNDNVLFNQNNNFLQSLFNFEKNNYNIMNNNNPMNNNNAGLKYNENASWVDKIIDKLTPDIDGPYNPNNTVVNNINRGGNFLDNIANNMLYAFNDVKEKAKDIDIKEKFKLAGEYVQNKTEIIQNSDTFKRNINR